MLIRPIFERNYLGTAEFSSNFDDIDYFDTSKPKRMEGRKLYQRYPFDISVKSPKNIKLKLPTGSGKGTILQFIIRHEAEKKPTVKHIIAEPQIVIAAELRDPWNIAYPEDIDINQYIPIIPGIDLTKPSLESNIKQLVDFLINPPALQMSDRILLCTHQTLALAYQYLFENNQLESFQDVSIWIDEAHHVLCHDTPEEEIECNRIGSMVRFIIENREILNCRVGLPTATFFRSDYGSIIPDKYKSEFDSFNFSYPEYFKTMKYLKGYTYNFVLYNGDPSKEIKDIFLENQKKTIVYLPSQNSKCRFDDKIGQIKKIIETITGTKIEKIPDDEDYFTITAIDGKQYNVMELIDSSPYRDKKKILIGKKEIQEKIDLLLVVGMGKEGFNWPQLWKPIIVGPRNSLLELGQIFGRPLRDYPGKDRVDVYHLLPLYVEDLTDKEKVRENLNDYLNSFTLSLLIEDRLDPIKIKINKKPLDDQEDSTEEEVEVLDENLLQIVVKEVRERMMTKFATTAEQDKKLTKDEVYAEHCQVIKEVLEEMGKIDCVEEICEKVWKMLDRHHSFLKEKGFDVSLLDFESIFEEDNPYTGFLYYASLDFNLKSWKQLEQAYFRCLNCYSAYEEAQEAVLKLGTKTSIEYRKRYQEDLRLPTRPDFLYKDKGWISWPVFLRNAELKYSTYEEAQLAVQKLCIKSAEEYKKRYQEDPKLPSNPNKIYKNKGWISWIVFLEPRRYSTYEEAEEAVQKLEIKSGRKYDKRRKEDPKLPATPYKIYKNKGWISWSKFLKNKKYYLNYEEAQKSAWKLGIKIMKEYYKRRKEDPKLPSNPNKIYKGKGWISWPHFLGTENNEN